MNVITEKIEIQVLEASIQAGVTDFCICPGARNACFIKLLKNQKHLQSYYFYDERSAAFFALGKCRAQQRPVALITTSGTAVAHLLAAAMEAYYTGTPLLLITADRPKRHRGCNTPQSCEQQGIYGVYTPFSVDLESGDVCDLYGWDYRSPAHINVCIEESNSKENYEAVTIESTDNPFIFDNIRETSESAQKELNTFLSSVKHPLIVVGTLPPKARKPLADFLQQLNAPLILEAQSGLRENPALKRLRITRSDTLWKHASAAGYPIDGVLRIGGVPTIRIWRDLEELQEQVKVLSINEVPFSGLSWGSVHTVSIAEFFEKYRCDFSFFDRAKKWFLQDKEYEKKLRDLIESEPLAEPSLIHHLSHKIPDSSLVYLGNSLPIREWDLAASWDNAHPNVYTNRGMNGIDGQTSTFLGLALPDRENWALLGDLTALHDLSAPWVLPQLNATSVQIVIINNKGGKIFSKMFAETEIQNNHELEFSSFAALWGIKYERWKEIPEVIYRPNSRIIELVPDNQATHRFWDKLNRL